MNKNLNPKQSLPAYVKDFSIFVLEQIHRKEANLCKVKEHYWILLFLQPLTPKGGTLVHNFRTMEYWYQTAGGHFMADSHAQSTDLKINISLVCVICPRNWVAEESIHLVQVDTEQISSLAIN